MMSYQKTKLRYLITPPPEGWKANTYYTVAVRFSENNTEHKALFYTGFLDNYKQPSGYNSIYNPTYERNYQIWDIFSLRVLEELDLKLNDL